jgi:hypothetical protein
MERESRMVDTAPAEQVSYDRPRPSDWSATVLFTLGSL